MKRAASDILSLPFRSGPGPRITRSNPQTQLDQQPAHPFFEWLRDFRALLPDVEIGPSLRAPPGTFGFFLNGAGNPEPEAFLRGCEFAHIHPFPDHSLHMTLPEPLRSDAIGKGWPRRTILQAPYLYRRKLCWPLRRATKSKRG